jgi:aspartyl-tRNA synthetase
MLDYRRTHTCGELREADDRKEVILSGWVHKRRNLGNLLFIDLRDRYGITQLIFDPTIDLSLMEQAEKLRAEWVVTIYGKVRPRGPQGINSKMATGTVEVVVDKFEILSTAKIAPFSIADDFIEISDELSLKYRYLEMRRGPVIQNLLLRHKVALQLRNRLDELGFTEVSTPILAKSTPEGSRDYLVPSRIYPGTFYALPQSPQLFKQLLMVGGLDKYFQIATCFRDEDLRADRQPEFTQIDIEMSFVTPEEIFKTVEQILEPIFSQKTPFLRLTHRECMERYGTDKPDLRFGMEFISLNTLAKESSAPFFHEALKSGGIVKGFIVKKGAALSRKALDGYAALIERLKAGTLYFVKYSEGALSGGVAKFFDSRLIDTIGMEEGDLLFILSGPAKKVHQGLDHLRRKCAQDLDLIDKEALAFLWVVDFPLFTFDEEENRIVAEHHPFTAPLAEDFPLLEKEPLKVRASAYDLVLNGYEVASGSQRIHSKELQEKIFKQLQLSEEELSGRFGFFLEALQYGTPPHAGIALGLDRLIMIMVKTENIRDVVAFPKTHKAYDLMMDAPSAVLPLQLKELKLNIHQEK